MLILSRRPGEHLVLMMGDHKATIELIAISGNRVRVGIDAPREIEVVREEIPLRTERRTQVLRETA
jgi:carbon storage regulator